MAEKAPLRDGLNEVALGLFKERSTIGGIDPSVLAVRCFADASAFLEVAEKIAKSGIPISDDSNPLDAACAPNLKKTHPINLMSQQMGNINKVKQVYEDLDGNPAATTYEELSWGPNEVSTARALFPAVIARATAGSKN